MKTLFYKTALSAAIAASLISCGGDSGVAGIGGSGFVATGAITGFGSVFVNGIEFETNSSTFDIDGSSGTQSELAVGMIVNVSGSINSDGVTGNATSISFDDQLQGPVASVSLPDDNDNITLSILGTTVRINAVSTLFDVSGLLPPATVFNFGNIFPGNNVEISGFFNDAGVLIATRVELKATVFSPSNIVELKGAITGLANTTFTVNGVNVDASSAQLDDLPNGLMDGVFVEVKGTCSDASCSTLTATRVEGEDNSIDDSNKVSIEGIITDFVNNSSFMIGGVSVDASSATFSPATLVLRDDLLIEVEGPVVGGVLKAITVEIRGSNAKVHANVSAMTAAGFDVTFNGATGPETIAVTVTGETESEDPITVTDFVRVRGFENENGGITATRVEVRNSNDDIIVQGNMSAFTADTSITVLGVTFQIDDTPPGNGETDFEDANDTVISQAAFITAAPVGTLVKIKDRDGGGGGSPLNGTADEIDIELD